MEELHVAHFGCARVEEMKQSDVDDMTRKFKYQAQF